MAIKHESKEIEGAKTYVVQFAALRSLKLLKVVGAALGPALAELSTFAGEDDVSVMGPALAALCERIDDIESLACQILAGTSVEWSGAVVNLAKKETIDMVYSGRLGALFTTLVFALQVNFGDFFAAALSERKGAATPADPPVEASA